MEDGLSGVKTNAFRRGAVGVCGAGQKPGALLFVVLPKLLAHEAVGVGRSSPSRARTTLARPTLLCAHEKTATCGWRSRLHPAERSEDGEGYATRDEAQASVFGYIETFYNRVRRHAPLGYVASEEYERTRNLSLNAVHFSWGTPSLRFSLIGESGSARFDGLGPERAPARDPGLGPMAVHPTAFEIETGTGQDTAVGISEAIVHAQKNHRLAEIVGNRDRVCSACHQEWAL